MDPFAQANIDLFAEMGEQVTLHIGATNPVVTGIYSTGYGESRLGGSGGQRGGAPIRPETPTLQLYTEDVEANNISKGGELTVAGKRHKIIDTPRPDGTGLSLMSIRTL